MTSSKAVIHGGAAVRSTDDVDSDLSSIRTTNIFERGLVIDTICDVSLRQEVPETLSEPQRILFSLAPRNSLICRIISTSEGLSDTVDLVVYPFFSSHIALPAKPGEQVWLFRQKILNGAPDDRTYWVTRISDSLPLEDANFTAFTRPHRLTQTGSEKLDRTLQFPNGDDDKKIIAGDDTALQQLLINSAEGKNIVLEAVPRLTKRPADTVLQGSNNTAIILGTERGWDATDRPVSPDASNAASETVKSPETGAIDIVVGRGRYFKDNESETKRNRKGTASKGVKNSTQPFIAKNSFGAFETDKDPAQVQDVDAQRKVDGEGPATPGNAKTNPAEGDPDFLVDASRIYVSTNSKIDKKLGKLAPKPFENKYEQREGPAIAIKSDHIRIVARKLPTKDSSGNLPEKFDSVAGSIRIVKEGNPDDDLAGIIIESDGTVHISGKAIYFGRSKDDGGDATGPGPGGAQPFIKYKQFEDLWFETMDSLVTFCDTVLTHVTPGYGAPSPQLNQAAAELKTKISSKLKQDIATLKSKRMFGE
jgi:hypothetical protein